MMKPKDFVQLLNTPEVEEALGKIMMKAINQALTRNIRMESGRDNPGGPSVIKEETWGLVDFLMKYFPYLEGAIRGAQADSAQSKNASLRMINALKTHFEITRPLYQALGNKETIILAETCDPEADPV